MQKSPARLPIPLPSVGQHLREFGSNPHGWVVLARNLIPVVGVYAFGWSAGLTMFNYWFDGLTALAAITAALVPRALRESETEAQRQSSLAYKILQGVITWVFLVGILGMPYWMVLVPLHTLLLGENVRHQVAQTPALWFAFGSIAFSHLWKALRSGYDVMPDDQLKQRARWDVYLLMLRGIAMFMMMGFAFFIVPLMALLLTYFELWPQRIIGAVFGDPTTLYQYNPEKDKSS